MATFNERIQVVIDVVTDKATKGFGDFRKAVSDAEGFTGKLKAGVSSLGGAFAGAIPGPAAMAAVVATAGKVAFESVNDFADLGIAVDNFATATGLSLESASRLYEVTNDLGGSTDALQTALNKMNKETDPKVFADLGIAIAKTDTGAKDVAGTFLNVIDRLNAIKDPTERAKQGTLLFGKAWTSLAPLIAAGADKIRKNMQDVADVKVFDEKKRNDARKFQAAMADLSDTVEELKLALGEDLLPVVKDTIVPLANLASHLHDAQKNLEGFSVGGVVKRVFDLGGAIKNLAQGDVTNFTKDIIEMKDSLGFLGDVVDWFVGSGTPGIKYTGEAITNMGDAAGQSARYLGLLADQQKRVTDGTNSVKGSLDAARDSLKKYQDQIKGRNDLVKLVTDLDGMANKLNEITMLHAAGEISDRDYWLQAATLTGEAEQAVSDYLDTVDGIPPTTKKKLLIEFDPNAPSKFLTDLQAEMDRKKIRVPVFPGFVMPGPQDGPNTDPRPPRQPAPQGTPKSTTPANVTINVAVPPGANQYEVGKATHDALQTYYRNGGT